MTFSIDDYIAQFGGIVEVEIEKTAPFTVWDIENDGYLQMGSTSIGPVGYVIFKNSSKAAYRVKNVTLSNNNFTLTFSQITVQSGEEITLPLSKTTSGPTQFTFELVDATVDKFIFTLDSTT